MKDYKGLKYGRLTVLDQKRKNKRTYLYCQCECGNKKWIRADALANGTISCGCYNKENNYKKPVDITGKKFGRLTAIKPTEDKDKDNGSIIWKCKCECGNTCYIPIYLLLKGGVKSCGCYAKDVHSKSISKALNIHLDKDIVEETNIPAITMEGVKKNNKSGVTGVRWDKSRNKWLAQISFQKKYYYLGRFENKEDAIKIRKKAEKELFGNFLEWYKENIKGK